MVANEQTETKCQQNEDDEIVTFNGDTHQYPTRSKNNFRIKHMKSAKARNLVFHKGLIEFNSLPDEVKNEASDGLFKSKLRSFLKTNL